MYQIILLEKLNKNLSKIFSVTEDFPVMLKVPYIMFKCHPLSTILLLCILHFNGFISLNCFSLEKKVHYTLGFLNCC